MKKLMLCAVAITALFSQDINAQEVETQKGLYFKVNGGYNFAITNSQHGVGEVPFAPMGYPFYSGSENSSGDIEWKVEDVNLGKGLSFGGTVGYAFNNHFGAEVEVDYLMGSKNKAKVTTNSGAELNQKLYSRMIQIKPSFVLSAGYSKINPYAKFGPIIGSGKIIQEYKLQSGSSLTEAEVEAKGGLAFGFHAGLGMSFGLTSKLSLFGELNMNNLSYAPEKGKLTELKQDGVSQNIGALDVSVREYEYTDQNPYVNIGGGPSPDTNKPYRAQKTSYSYGTLGINIGLKYSL